MAVTPKLFDLKLAFVAGLIVLTVAPFAVQADQTQNLNSPNEDDINCETQRSADYYGLGVRLGIYFAWLTSYVANIALPGEVAGAVDTNSIFLFALLISMIRCSITGMLDQIDGLILMQLSSGTIFGVLSLWGYRTCHYRRDGPKAIRHFGGFGTHLRLLLSLAINVYGLWFWMHGIHTGLNKIPKNKRFTSECAVIYTFMFKKFRATGGIQTFNIIVCMVCTFYFGVMLVASSLAGWSRASKIVSLVKNKQWSSTSRLRFATGLNMKELRYCFKILSVLNLFWLIFSAVMVEFTLNFNHVKGVLGEDGDISLPAQIIPMLIGAFSFVRILWILFKEWRSPGDTDPSMSADPSQPHKRASTQLPTGLAILKVFSPSLNNEATETSGEHDDTEIDPLVEYQPRWQRYLVTWLPWLTLTKWRRNSNDKRWQKLPMTYKEQESQMPQASMNETPLRRLSTLPPQIEVPDFDKSDRHESWKSISTEAEETDDLKKTG